MMRQAVVNFASDVLADRGLQFEVFEEAGILDIEILSCEGPRGVSRIHVEEQLDPQRLDAMDAIQWWEQVSSEGSAYVYLVEADSTEADNATLSGEQFPRCERVRVGDRGLTLTLAGPGNRLREALADLDREGTDVSLEKLHGYRVRESPLDALTSRQREVLEAAFERGYFDVPRDSSVREIAGEFDLDDSTVAEHLQRAERNLLQALFEDPR